MSISASIDLHLTGIKHNQKSSIEIIDILIASGWTLVHDGYVTYLPIGDKDSFNWKSTLGMEHQDIEDLMDAKRKANEIIGVTMTWKDTQRGGSFLFWPEGTYETLSLNLHAFRPTKKIAKNYEVTDFQWYLEKLLPPLNDAFGVEYFSCEEHR